MNDRILPPVPYELEIAELRKALAEARLREQTHRWAYERLQQQAERRRRENAALTRLLLIYGVAST